MSYHENEIKQKLEQIFFENAHALMGNSCEDIIKQLKVLEDLEKYFFDIFYEKLVRFEDYGIDDRTKILGKQIDEQREKLLENLKIKIKRYFSFEGQIKIEWIDSSCKVSNAKKIIINDLKFFDRIEKFHISFNQCSFVSPSIRVEKSGVPSNTFNDVIRFDNISITRCSFIECTFEAPLYFTKIIFKNHCTFKNCCFQKNIFIEECEFQDGVNFSESRFCSEVNFRQNQFSKQSFFIHSIFDKKTSFKENNFISHCFFTYTVCNGDIEFVPDYPLGGYGGFRENAYFSHIHFKAKALFYDTIFFQNADFAHAIFEGETSFNCAQFKGDVFFEQLRLEKKGALFFRQAKIGEKDCEKKIKIDFSRAFFGGDIDLSSTYFYGDTYFHRAVFGKSAQFYRSYFEGVVNFYFADFRGIPNFSMCVFSQPKFVNFVGVALPQNTIDKLGDYISQKAGDEANKKDNTEKGRTTNYLCIQHSLNIRDSFRVIKETLIAQGNLLDTQQWHKLELYAKELEYKYRNDISTLSQEVEELKKQEKIKDYDETDSVKILEINKNELEKNKIDRWQLWFYRQISDHHTNLAQIITNLVLLISLFGIYTLALFSLSKTTEILKTDSENIAIFAPLQTITFVFSKNPTQIPQEWQIFSYFVVFFSGIYSYCVLRKQVGGLAFGISAIDALVFLFFVYCYRFDFYEAILIAFLCLSFVGMYVILLWKKHILITSSSFVFCFIVLLYKPSLLLPFVGQLFDEGLKANFPAMQSLSVVYCILMFLMLFSLQKTARKNSIIPS